MKRHAKNQEKIFANTYLIRTHIHHNQRILKLDDKRINSTTEMAKRSEQTLHQRKHTGGK